MIADISQAEAAGREDGIDARGVGKIARLPKEGRDVVNRMLQDGAPHADISAWVKKAYGVSLRPQNITNWYQHGYQTWLKEQTRLDDMKAKREFALEVVKQNEGSQIHEAGLQIAATQIYELLNDFDVETLKEKLSEDPANYARIVNAMSKLSESGLKYERYRAEVQNAKERIASELGKARSKGGVTPETLELIERELKLL